MVSINHIIIHVLNFTVGSTLIVIKFQDMSSKGMSFIFNHSDHHDVGPTVTFSYPIIRSV